MSNGMRRTGAPLRDEEHHELERYRAALGRAVERTSLREIARQVGMSPVGLRGVLRGAAMYSKTRERIRAWYTVTHDPQADEMPDALAAALVRRAVVTVPAAHRAEAQRELLDAIAEIHRRHRARRPRWLAGARRILEAEESGGVDLLGRPRRRLTF